MTNTETNYISGYELTRIGKFIEFLNDSRDGEFADLGFNIQVFDTNGEVLGYVYSENAQYVFGHRKPGGM